METLLLGIESSGLAQFLRFSRWGYAAVNAMHIAGFAMLVGSILPLDLKLLGAWPSVNRHDLVRVLVPVAAAGLAIAVLAGLLLFSIRAPEYAQLAVFRIKLALIFIGAASALSMHWRYGRLLQDANRRSLRLAAATSILCWLGALICGRLIAFQG